MILIRDRGRSSGLPDNFHAEEDALLSCAGDVFELGLRRVKFKVSKYADELAADR